MTLHIVPERYDLNSSLQPELMGGLAIGDYGKQSRGSTTNDTLNIFTSSPDHSQIVSTGLVSTVLRVGLIDVLGSKLRDIFTSDGFRDLSGIQKQIESIIDLVQDNATELRDLRDGVIDLFQLLKSSKMPLRSPLFSSIAKKIGVRPKTLEQTLRLGTDWKNLSSRERLYFGARLTTGILEDVNVLKPSEARKYRSVADAIMLSVQSEGSTTDKALAIAGALSQFATTSFAGAPHSPLRVMDIPVVGSALLPSGERGFLLENGDVVSEQALINARNVGSALQAISTLVGDKKLEEKLLSLAETGLSAARTNGLISDAHAARAGGVLSLANIASRWSEMDDAQRFVASIQGGEIVLDALGRQAGKTLLSKIASGAGAIAGIVTGGKQAVDVIDMLRNVPRSQGVRLGAIGLGSAGAAIGAGVATVSSLAAGASLGATLGSSVPVVGTIIGAVVGAGVGALIGAFGSKKNKGQVARDSWRKAMEQAQFAKKIDGSHHLPLADGTTYNIGRDGKSQLQNLDGSERLTHVLDWKNPLATENIPLGHLYVIATGLNPTTHKGRGLFHAAVAQSLNAATSNATTDMDVYANFRTMLEAGGSSFSSLRQQVELLRVTNRITEEEYTVYLHHLSKLSGETLEPTDRVEMHQAIVEQIHRMPEQDDGVKELLELLTDQGKYEESLEALDVRLEEQEKVRRKEAA
jgi:hypothetical protein